MAKKVNDKTSRRRVRVGSLNDDAKLAPQRLVAQQLRLNRSPVAWNSIGMPLPGPNFRETARRVGDVSEIVTKKVKDPDTGITRTETTVVIGQKLKHLYDRALRDTTFELPVEISATSRRPVKFVPGHLWGQPADAHTSIAVDGPHPADIMVIGKMPGQKEERASRNMVGEAGCLLLQMLRDLKFRGMSSWYVTNLLKFRLPDGIVTPKAGWIQDCLPLLHQELRIVRPKYILCLGADAAKALLGKKCTLSNMEGRAEELTFSIGRTTATGEQHTIQHTALVMAVLNPAQILRSQGQDQRRILEKSLSRFSLLIQGRRFDRVEFDIDHRQINNADELYDLLYEVEHDPEKHDDVVAVDAEWHGEHPCNTGSYVRTIQFSWRPKCACAVVLNAPGGGCCFLNARGRPAAQSAIKMLSTFFNGGVLQRGEQQFRCRPKRVVGHFFNADLEWLVDMGLDLRPGFSTPLWDRAYNDCSVEVRQKLYSWGYRPGDTIAANVLSNWIGGADTGLMAHAIEETTSYSLESLALRYTEVPRYDVPLQEWKVKYCSEQGIKAKDMEGYGFCPDEVLVPYGIYDADATLRLFYALDNLLNCDYDGNVCREAFWEAMIAAPAVLEIHRNGVAVDKQRIDDLSVVFVDARLRQEEKIRKWARWPEFNIRSLTQTREFLFGEQYNGKKRVNGEPVRLRPAKARALKVMPFLDTSKPPQLWREIRDRGQEREHSPGTGKAVLSVLSQDNLQASDQIDWIRDYRFLDQVLKSTLRPPLEREDGSWATEAEVKAGGDIAGLEYTSFGSGLGGLIYDAGLASQICTDGRVRTHIYQTKETGRWSSARPNLQNISKSRDPDYLRMLGAAYKHKLRSIVTASDGYVLVEADYTGAELFGMAIMAGDEAMIDHCLRNQLPKGDPNFYDIHSNIAVLAFNLKCAPTQEGLKSVPNSRNLNDKDGMLFSRTLAKSVVFGLAYGRGAKAIAMAAREIKVVISTEQAQQVIDAVFAMYPKLAPFFETCRKRALEDGWLCNCFGRFRRFPPAPDQKMAGEFERQAMNYPIQSMIASTMNRAMAYLYHFRKEGKDTLYRILLQVHDAVLLEVPYANVERVVDEILPLAMCRMIPIYPTTLDGVPTGKGPYHLGIECEVMTHWSERISEADCRRWNIPMTTAGGHKLVS